MKIKYGEVVVMQCSTCKVEEGVEEVILELKIKTEVEHTYLHQKIVVPLCKMCLRDTVQTITTEVGLMEGAFSGDKERLIVNEVDQDLLNT